MTHYTQNGNIPQHLFGYAASEILYGLDPEKVGEFEFCSIFGVTSIPSRALHFTILLESKAQFTRIPIHMIRHEMPKPGAPVRDCHDLQFWDSHGWQFSVIQYDYLREMGCHFLDRNGNKVPASYWFTLDWTDNGWSLYPPEHKCAHLLLLEDGSGQVAAMPNNRILWEDNAIVGKDSVTADKRGYKVMPPVTWHAEAGRNPQDTAITQDVE